MRVFHNLNVNWMGMRKAFYILSLVLFLLGMLNIVFRGLVFGIDFKGGSEIVLQFEKPVDVAKIRNDLANIGLGAVEVRTFGAETGVLVRTELQEIPKEIYPKVVERIRENIDKIMPAVPYQIVDSTINSITVEFTNPDTTNTMIAELFAQGFQTGKVSEEPDNKQMLVRVGIADWIKEVLREKVKDNPFQVVKEDRVGPKIGEELKRDAVLAVLLSLVVILIYLGFRFKFIFAIGAVTALFHDVLITVGLYAVLYGLIPGLNLEIDLPVVAAFLTLVGYSINDTVIVFDRIRENMKIHKTMPLEELINKSINQTMSRTIITGFTTLLAVFVLFILGGDVLRAFSFTLLFGIIIGTYSSIFVASALVLDYAQRTKKKVQFS
ncbi:Preprotein translocase subunit SecF [Ignavibacterium album JCM 16511]|uniref:Protein-export membrane protein SecF n=1 Tax=Ignavibacterium album (strain DSM 19864 / JCM 16511 / NBRC 101810 / Mat9-16) TaxID=945713 RepID=I0AHT9_IGNAJ|nr:protein translocase subunit SecF [Ignavibacterium album]AFH48546.1 Preprotein translocase subunit SecF [Ignavibacterium album JCM 16511]